MPSSAKRSLKVFLDSNIFIAAILSSRGGSFRIMQEARVGNVIVFITSFIMDEIARTLYVKYPTCLNHAHELIASTPLLSINNPSSEEIERLEPLISDMQDAPVLAGDLKSKAQFLITLDRKHFFTKTLLNARLAITIQTPRDFLTNYFD